jgi:CMP-N-acetylneuraminic acid synthetase/regulator of RNase E activity RraA
MNIVAFIPAKGHSERVSGKNLRVLDGEYLFKRKLRQALDCAAITEVCLDTDSDDFAALADDLPVSRLSRPADLATNQTDGHALFAWECAQRPHADFWVQILCTAPFVSADTIQRAIEALLADPHADSLVAVTRAKQYCWEGATPLYGTGRIPNSVELPPTVVEAMSLYIVRRPAEGGPPGRRFGTSPILFDLDPIELIDINHDADLVIAETIAAGQRAKEVTRFRAMLPHLSSTVLADICKERGLRTVLPPELRPTSGGKLLGRARTLQLTGLADPSDRASGEWKGIYDALQSYRFVRPGDVIMVATDVPGRAYFGDLNANLAIRSGAVGAVIDGTTRDTADVRALGFPVYARRSHCDDIKFEGTMKSMNRPVEMGGVTVSPQAEWPAIEAAAWDVMANEGRIRMYAARGRDVNEILAECGAF